MLSVLDKSRLVIAPPRKLQGEGMCPFTPRVWPIGGTGDNDLFYWREGVWCGRTNERVKIDFFALVFVFSGKLVGLVWICKGGGLSSLPFFFFSLSLPSSCCFIWHCRMGWAVGPIFCGGPSPARGECHTTPVGCQFQFSSFHKGRRRRPKKKLRINKARTGPVFDSAKKPFGIFSAHCMNVVGFYSI